MAYNGETVKINDEFIENLIDGYMTIRTEGRETLTKELEEFEVGSSNGSRLKGSRYPKRVIEVTYSLSADSMTELWSKFDTLNEILGTENAEFIFNDEPDKFFVGTPVLKGIDLRGSNAAVGTYEIHCLDPFKYSVEEYESEAEDGEFIIEYGGTHPAHPIFETRFFESETNENGDCGYVAFVNEDEKIIQIGNIEEADAVEIAPSETLVNNKFPSSAWSTSTITTPVVSTQVKAGTIGTKTIGSTKWLIASNYGSNANGGHGPIDTVTIPADSLGVVGAENFRASCSLLFSKTKAKQDGNMFFYLSDVNKAPLCGVRIYSNAGTTKGTVAAFIGTTIVKSFTNIDLSKYNKQFGRSKSGSKITRVISITKSGSKITFDIGGLKFTIVQENLELTKACYMSVQFTAHKSVTPIFENGISWAKFIKDNSETLVDIPNSFTTNDIVTCDCSEAAIYLSHQGDEDTQGERNDSLGAVGNDWESFVLKSGTNQIGVTYSDWVEELRKPTFKVRWREVFK